MSPAKKGSASTKAPSLPRSTTPPKRPWQTPQVRTGHLFESNSLACGKNSAQLEQCIQNPVMS